MKPDIMILVNRYLIYAHKFNKLPDILKISHKKIKDKEKELNNPKKYNNSHNKKNII